MQMFFFLNEYRSVLFKRRSFIGDVYVPFCVVVINEQKYCFVRKNRIASKPKRFLYSTISGKIIQGSKVCLKHTRNQQKIMSDSSYYVMLLGKNVQ